MLQSALTLMMLGMGTVFTFLTLLVFAVTLMSKLVTRFEGQAASSGQALTTDKPTHGEPVLIAAISTAIHQHRQKQGK